VRTADADVERYLKLFTFLTLPEIQGLMAKHKHDPSARVPHHALAYEFVSLVHGETAAKETESQHKSIFSKSPLSLDTNTAAVAKNNPLLSNQNATTRLIGSYTSAQLNPFAEQTNAQSTTGTQQVVLPKSLIYNQPIARVLHAAGLVTSRSEGHRLAEGKGAYIGRRSSDNQEMSDDVSWVPAKPRDPLQTWTYVIKDSDPNVKTEPGEEGLLLLRVGKWKVRIVRIVSDDKYERMDVKDPPSGWLEMKALLSAMRQRKAFETKGRMVESQIKEKREADATAMASARMSGGRAAGGVPEHADVTVHSETAEWNIESRQGRGKRNSALEGFKSSRKLGEQHIRKELKAEGLPRPNKYLAQNKYKKPAISTTPGGFRIRYQGEHRQQDEGKDKDEAKFKGQGRGRTGGPKS